jgi:DNA-directed RNA polymerase subunit F
VFQSKSDVGLPQLDAMRQGTNYRIKIVVRQFVAYLRPLTMDETTKVVSEVAAYLSTVPQERRTPIFENGVLAKYTLKLASTSDEDKEDPQLGDLLLGKLTPDELQSIWKQYQKGLEMCDPDLEELPPEKLKEMVEDLKKNPSTMTELSFWELGNVCRYLIQEGQHEDK